MAVSVRLAKRAIIEVLNLTTSRQVAPEIFRAVNVQYLNSVNRAEGTRYMTKYMVL